jgi:hypothetical protein
MDQPLPRPGRGRRGDLRRSAYLSLRHVNRSARNFPFVSRDRTDLDVAPSRIFICSLEHKSNRLRQITNRHERSLLSSFRFLARLSRDQSCFLLSVLSLFRVIRLLRSRHLRKLEKCTPSRTRSRLFVQHSNPVTYNSPRNSVSRKGPLGPHDIAK